MGAGRPPYEPTPEQRSQVEALTAFGITQEHIAAILGICVDTLAKYYRSELDLGVAKATARVASNLFKKATGDGKDSAVSAMFWLKTRAGWREVVRQEVEHSGEVGVVERKIVKANAAN